jgi:hypothetical protein
MPVRAVPSVLAEGPAAVLEVGPVGVTEALVAGGCLHPRQGRVDRGTPRGQNLSLCDHGAVLLDAPLPVVTLALGLSSLELALELHAQALARVESLVVVAAVRPDLDHSFQLEGRLIAHRTSSLVDCAGVLYHAVE